LYEFEDSLHFFSALTLIAFE